MSNYCRHHTERPRPADETYDEQSLWRWQDSFVMYADHNGRRDDEDQS